MLVVGENCVTAMGASGDLSHKGCWLEYRGSCGTCGWKAKVNRWSRWVRERGSLKEVFTFAFGEVSSAGLGEPVITLEVVHLPVR